jgi:hypothetical protein
VEVKAFVCKVLIVGFIGLTFGGTAYANGNTGASSSGMAWYTWVTLIFCIITAGLTASYWKRRKRKEGRLLKGAALLAGTFAVLMGAFNSAGMWEKEHEAESINLIHVHGVAYAQDGGSIMVATHDGIKWYGNGSWQSGEGERHDYMGFSPFEGGFYSSGHPVPGSSLQNPLGLIKSTDNGKSVQVLSLHGKADFHLVAASYRKPVLYVYNHEPRDVLKQPGLFYTKDDGKSWTKSSMAGFVGEPTALAVHPDRPELVAVGSRDGLFLSNDQGNSFEKLLSDTGISALSFDRDGQLTVGGFKDKPSLLQLDPASKAVQEVPLPEMKEDAIAYTVHHPSNPRERVISTFDQDVLLTVDGGITWTRLADNGKTKPEPDIMPKPVK